MAYRTAPQSSYKKMFGGDRVTSRTTYTSVHLCSVFIPDNMSVRYLGFVLLVGFPGVLPAQSPALPCPAAPSLNGGYWVREQAAYSDGTKLFYACDKGLKPAVEGWWGAATCQNGSWSHKPQCIDEKACLPPVIPNGKYIENSDGWYEDKDKIWITCDKGYKHREIDATAKCINGTWHAVPVCEKSIDTCGEPPQIPHAVVIHQGYRDFFAVDSEVQYECEDGFTLDRATKKSIVCIAGNWSEGPTCISLSRTRPGSGQAEAGTAGGRPTSTGSRTQPAGGVTNCGKPPLVPNGDVVEITVMALRYQCASFYELVGPETVVCYSNGKWSIVPTCKEAFCTVNTEEYPALIPDGVKIIKEGETVRLECVRDPKWWTDHFSVARCTNGIKTLSRCCDRLDAWTVC